MDKLTSDLDFLSSIFKVLSDPTRLKLFGILLGGVHCNCELGSLTGLANNLISHHMRVLTEAGLIQSARKPGDARWIFYSVNREKLDQMQQGFAVFLNPDQIPDREPICPPNKKVKKSQEQL